MSNVYRTVLTFAPSPSWNPGPREGDERRGSSGKRASRGKCFVVSPSSGRSYPRARFPLEAPAFRLGDERSSCEANGPQTKHEDYTTRAPRR
eukprot:scaffold23102_cov31-Tisochrysis_lutea.AAC.1